MNPCILCYVSFGMTSIAEICQLSFHAYVHNDENNVHLHLLVLSPVKQFSVTDYASYFGTCAQLLLAGRYCLLRLSGMGLSVGWSVHPSRWSD